MEGIFMKSLLKPCPFCGSPAKFCTDDNHQSDNYNGSFIECVNCHASTAIVFPIGEEIRDKVESLWNTRRLT